MEELRKALKKELIESIDHLLGQARSAVILMHTNPDGDAVGSALAMWHYLKARNIAARVIAPDEFPDFLAWMPGASDILIHDRERREARQVILEADLLICVDFNTADRLNGVQADFEESKAPCLLIDHHISRGKFCDIAYTDTEISSTAELLYRLIDESGHSELISREAAECLFVGIMTDTGSFSYACHYANTFTVTAELVRKGIDVEHIHRQVYDTYSEKRLRLLGYCLSEKLHVMQDIGTAWIALSIKELEKFEFRNGDTEGVVNYTLGIKGVQFGALITERQDKIKISLRSKGSFDVNRIARSHFNGGGHKNAAGGDLYCSFDEAVVLFQNVIAQYASELKNLQS